MNKIHNLSDLTQALEKAKTDYKYQKELTQQLDTHSGDFSKMTLLEIALWKTNRYPTITDDLLIGINDLRKKYSEEKAKKLLRALLDLKGFDLPMASTVLRFAVPDQLQIIDQRVYRFITPNEDYLNIPYNKDEKVKLYFSYIERLKKICSDYNIPFSNADRLLYQLDKNLNKKFRLKTSA